MRGNPITVEGACLILQCAVDNGVCYGVGTHYDDDEMKNILEQRKDKRWEIEQ